MTRPYTDGNWTVCPNNPRKIVSDSLDGLDPLTGESVVGGAAAGPKAEANARLMAAGPDMLAALKDALMVLQSAAAADPSWHGAALSRDRVVRVIAKAEVA